MVSSAMNNLNPDDPLHQMPLVLESLLSLVNSTARLQLSPSRSFFVASGDSATPYLDNAGFDGSNKREVSVRLFLSPQGELNKTGKMTFRARDSGADVVVAVSHFSIVLWLSRSTVYSVDSPRMMSICSYGFT